MKIKKGTLGFNFFLAFVLFGIICLVIALAFVFNALALDRMANLAQNTTHPIQSQAYRLAAGYQAHTLHFHSYLATQEAKHKASADVMLFETMPATMDTLGQLIGQIDGQDLLPKYEVLAKQLEETVARYRKLEDRQGTAQDWEINQYLQQAHSYAQFLGDFNDYLLGRFGQDSAGGLRQMAGLYYWAIPAVLGLFYLVYLLIRWPVNTLFGGINDLKNLAENIATGNIPKQGQMAKHELGEVQNALRKLVENLKNVKSFAQEVGSGNLDTNLAVFDNKGDLGSALAEMKNSLKKLSEESETRDWANKGMADFGSLIQDHADELDVLAGKLITNLANYTRSVLGCLYVAEDGGNGQPLLVQKACYAYDRQKFIDQALKPGEGVVGQVFLEKKPTYLKEVPDGYAQIASGLGKAAPRFVYVQPMIVNEAVEGVIELASFKPFPEHVRAFVGRLSENIAASISTSKNNEQLKAVLGESREMTEQMKSQEEELRQNTEELQATQEEMERRIKELEQENMSLKNVVPLKGKG